MWPVRKLTERVTAALFLTCAGIAVLAVALISLFIFLRGGPVIAEIGLGKFLFGTTWQPSADIYGIWPMIVASILSGLMAVTLGAAIGLLTAVFLVEIATGPWQSLLRPAIDLLAGVPSVVYGFFGLTTVVPLIRVLFGGPGNSLLAAVIILTIMVLPTITSIAVEALKAVPNDYREASLALGATKMQTIFRVLFPAARPGILAGVLLGTGRAIGETMAVLLVAGNRPRLPSSLIDPVRTLTGNIAYEMAYASGMHQDALFATGVVLFIFIMLLNLLVRFVVRERREN